MKALRLEPQGGRGWRPYFEGVHSHATRSARCLAVNTLKIRSRQCNLCPRYKCHPCSSSNQRRCRIAEMGSGCKYLTKNARSSRRSHLLRKPSAHLGEMGGRVQKIGKMFLGRHAETCIPARQPQGCSEACWTGPMINPCNLSRICTLTPFSRATVGEV